MTSNNVSIPNSQPFQDLDETDSDLAIISDYLSREIRDGRINPVERAELLTNMRNATPKIRAGIVAEIREAYKVEAEQAEQAQSEQAKQAEQCDDEAEIIQLHPERVTLEELFPEYEDHNTYTVVENWLLEHPDPRIGGTEIAIYTLLDHRAHMPKKTCEASINALAKRTGWKWKTVDKAIKNLEAIGAIKRPKEREAGEAYMFVLPHRHRAKPKRAK